MKPKKKEKVFYCPYCGNDAPYYVKADKPWRCRFCKQVFSRDERIKG